MELEKIDIEALKKEHGEIHYIELATDTPGQMVGGIFKKPNIKVLTAVSKTAETDKVGAALVMYNMTKVLVDPEIEKSEELKMSATEAVAELFKKYTYTAKKL